MCVSCGCIDDGWVRGPEVLDDDFFDADGPELPETKRQLIIDELREMGAGLLGKPSKRERGMTQGWFVSYPDRPPVIFNDENFDNEAAAKALASEDPTGKAIARQFGGATTCFSPAVVEFMNKHCSF